jgi:bifunctional non-homologous end joining protein LigD
VSVPIDWSELDVVESGAHWTVRNVGPRFERGNTPWQEYATTRQTLSTAMKALAFKPAASTR